MKNSDFRILIVDDQPANIRVLGSLLKERGYLVHATGEGEQAVAAACAVSPDLILLDVLMPGIDGFEICGRLKRTPATQSIPVIFLTVRNDRESILKGFRLGAVDYVTKPFDSVELLARVRTHTTLGRLTSGLRQEVADQTQEIQDANDRLRRLASEISLVEERERRRLASDLHDATIQKLALAQMQLETAERELQTGESLSELRRGIALVDESIRELRTLVFDLSPPILYELGLDAALEWLAAESERRWGLVLDCELSPGVRELPQERAILMFQSVRELVLNAGKHAGATRGKILAHRDASTVSISVIDEGSGFDPHTTPVGPQSGFGLFNIRQRMALLGGDVEIRSGSQGTHVTLSLPLPQP